MSKTWKIGLVGFGRGCAYARVFASRGDCEIAACCDASQQALERFQRELALPDERCFTNYEDFLGVEMDAVFVGTPIAAHAEQAVAALDAGINVLSEVTAASTLEECGRIVEAVRRSGKTYMLAENCVFWPFVQEWRRLVRAGRLGEVFYAECEYLHAIPERIIDPNTGEHKWRAERPPVHYCSHSLGPVLEIMGDRIVRAMGLGQGHRIMPDAPIGGIDIQVALFQTSKDAIIKLLRSSVAPRHPPIHYYMLQGTRGFVETDRGGPAGTGQLFIEEEMERAHQIRCSFVDESLPAEARAGGHGTAEYGVVQEFLRALQTGEKPLIDEVRAMDFTVPGLIAHESAMRGGIWLEVPSFAQER